MNLKSDLSQVFKGELLDDTPTLTTYSKDASLYEIQPQLIAYPQNSEDIKKLVQFVSKNPDQKLSITPRSAGTCMSGGAINDSVILDMSKHFNKVIGIDEGGATTQPGVFYRDFEKETLKKNLLLPCYTASRELNTVGGMVGNNSAGEKTLAYGQTKNYVKRLKVVFYDGNEYEVKPLSKDELEAKMKQKDFEGGIYRKMFNLVKENQGLIQKFKPKVSKNSAGYNLWDVWDGEVFDLTKLITGSQGTLGIVTEIGFKLVQPKTHSNLVVIFLYSLDHLGEVVNKILGFEPESFESYDDQTLKFAVKFWPEILKVLKPKNLLSLAWQFLPEVLMTIKHGFPKMVLLAEFTGNSTEEVRRKCLDAQKSIGSFHLQSRIANDETDEGKKYWVIRRESFSLFRKHAGNKHTAPFIDDFVVDPNVLPQFLPELNAILRPYKKRFVYTVAGHIGNGNLHIIPLVDLTDPVVRQQIPEISEKVYNLVLRYKGSITGEHNDGLVRGPYLPQMFGEDMYQLFKEAKNIFDPQNIFNPHKKADATFEYSLKHLAKS